MTHAERIAALLCLASLLLLPASARSLSWEHEKILRFAPSEGVVAGYRAYLQVEGGAQDVLDLGVPPVDASGAGNVVLALDGRDAYDVYMTAYDAQGLESPPSNVLTIARLACVPGACDDGDPCTADTCAESGCVHSAVADETYCGDELNPVAVCLAGRCETVECLETADCADLALDVCNGVPTCAGYTCVQDQPLSCPAQTQCRDAGCSASEGCWWTDREDGTACDDGQADTVGDVCKAGACVGTVQTIAEPGAEPVEPVLTKRELHRLRREQRRLERRSRRR